MKNLIASLALAAAALGMGSGCALLEPTLAENAALRAQTKNYQLTPELAAVAVDLKLSEVQEVVETFDENGKVVSRTTTTNITRGLPVMTESADVAMSTDLADEDTNLTTAADHAGNNVAVTRSVRGRADLQEIVGQTQVARTDISADLAVGVVQAAAGVFTKKIEAERDVDINKSNNETTLGLKQLETLPEHGGEEPSPENAPEAPAE